MEKSTHRVDVVVVNPKPHPNADRLEVVEVYGYSVCVRKGDFQGGDLGVYIPPDSIVPQTAEFRFVWEMKGYPTPPATDEVPEKYRRIKAKTLRGVVSEGLLLPAQSFGELYDGDENISIPVGYDVATLLGITHYNPPEDLTGDCDVSPTKTFKKKKRFPRTIRGWISFLLAKIGLRTQGMNSSDQKEEISFHIPEYDIDAWQRYKSLLKDGEEVWITEKIHGANVRYVWMPFEHTSSPLQGRMFCGSHYQWKKDNPGSSFWSAMRQNPWIESFCRRYPRHVLYGEMVPVQTKFGYGQEKGHYRIFAFDVYDMDNHKWLNWKELFDLTWTHPYMEDEILNDRDLLDEIHWAPTIFMGYYNEHTVRAMSIGDSLVPHANTMREGIVIKPTSGRSDQHFGRVILKLKSIEFLDKH